MMTSIVRTRRSWPSLKSGIAVGGTVARRRDELEFLPAALEVLETPASPVGRAVALLIALLALLILAWAYWGYIDMVAVAQGRLIPGGHVKLIQPVELGEVRAIHVSAGQRVEAGQLLVELDPTESEVDKDQILQTLKAARMEAHRLEVTLRKLDGEKSEMTPIDGVDPILFREQQQKMQADLDEYHASLAALKSQGNQVEAERQAKLAEVGKLEALLPIIEEQEQAFRTLLERKMGSRLRWLEVKRELIEHRQELLVLQRQVEELDAAFQAGIERQNQLIEALRKIVSGERLEVLQRITQAKLELKAAETRERRNRLMSPVDGVVEELTVHTVGGVVRPADVLMKIIPEGTSLEVEAMVLNKDVGFVREGQEVEVKLESFPFTKYGLVEGTINKLSADAILDERKGLVYPVRVALPDTRIRVDDGWVSLKPGMAVTAEIKTGQRRLIEFFLAPLLKYKEEAFRER